MSGSGLFRALIAAAVLAVTPAQVPAGDAARTCMLCLYGPDNMVFDAAGDSYLTDTDGKHRSRLLRLSAKGTVLGDWRFFADVPGARNGPEGVALTRDGNVLVTDGGASRVWELNPRKRTLHRFGGDVRFEDLGHIAVAPNGRIYIAEAKPNFIYQFSAEGRLLARWHRPKGHGPNEWGGPETIASLPNGNLVVEDWANRRIEILSSDGRTERIFGGAGRKPGEFMVTAGLGVDARGNIYVADVALHRLQKFDSKGRFMATIGNTKDRNVFKEGPSAVAIDHRFNLFVPDGLSLLELSQDGAIIHRWR